MERRVLVTLVAILLFCNGALSQQIFADADRQQLTSELSGEKQSIRQFRKQLAELRKAKQHDMAIETCFAKAFQLALEEDYSRSIALHKKAMRMHKRLKRAEAVEIELNLGLTYHLAGKQKKARKILGDSLNAFL